MPAERAGYTVTMFLIDVSPSMGKLRCIEVQDSSTGQTHTVEMSNLEWGLQFVLLKVQEMIYHGRKTEQCGVLLFGTEETDNIINEANGGYEHVSEYIPISQPNVSTLAKLQALRPSTEIGDPVDAIIVGIETQDRYLGKRKTWTRKMVLLTDAESPIELEDWELATKKVNELQIYTTIIGIDFDDEDFGYKEANKSVIKRENEKFFHEYISKLDKNLGIIGTAAFALQECIRPDVKVTKSALLGTTLRLGDADTRPEESIELPIKLSKCTASVRPASMKKFAKRSNDKEESQDNEDYDPNQKDAYAQLVMQSEYFLHKKDTDGGEEDEDESFEKTTEKVDSEQLIRGFKYGASYVPCPDGQFPRLSTRKGIDICGFFPEDQIRRDFAMGEVQYVWAEPSSGQVQVAFSSIVKAMIERKVVAIARLVSRDEMDPKMGILVPREFEEVDCLLWLQMPFADDVRRYTFPSLEHLVSKKGEPITEHPFLPTEKQMDAMDKFVDAMDLMDAGDRDENGERLPWFDPRLSYNPAVHRIKQALFHAAVVTDLRSNPVPPPHPEITKYFEPPRKVQKRVKEPLGVCKELFNVKKVPKRIAQRKTGINRAEDDDDEELLLDGPQSREYVILSQEESQDQEESQEISQSQKSDTNGGPVKPRSSAFVNTQSQSQDGFRATNFEFAGLDREHLVTSLHPLTDLENLEKNAQKAKEHITQVVAEVKSVIDELLRAPFAARRHDELVDCMRKLRVICKKAGETDLWNHFLRDLKLDCTESPIKKDEAFWKKVKAAKDTVNLIARTEAENLGLQSNISDEEAGEFI